VIALSAELLLHTFDKRRKYACGVGGQSGNIRRGTRAGSGDRIWVHSLVDWWENLIPKYDDSVVIKMFRFFKHRLPARKFKNSSSTETPVGPGRPSRAWVRTDYNLASVSSKGRKFGVRSVLGKRRTDWTLGNTDCVESIFFPRKWLVVRGRSCGER